MKTLAIVVLALVCAWQFAWLDELSNRNAEMARTLEVLAKTQALQAYVLNRHEGELHQYIEAVKLQNQVNQKLDRQDADNSAAIVKCARYFADHYAPLVGRVNFLYERVYTAH